MKIDIKVPHFPESSSGANVLDICVNDSQYVSSGQLLFEIETEKVVLEVVAPENGIIQDIQIEPGTLVTGGQLAMHFLAEYSTAANKPDVESDTSLHSSKAVTPSVDVDHSVKAHSNENGKLGMVFGLISLVLLTALIVFGAII